MGTGSALIGVGIMLLSLHVLSAATEPFRDSVALRSFPPCWTVPGRWR